MNLNGLSPGSANGCAALALSPMSSFPREFAWLETLPAFPSRRDRLHIRRRKPKRCCARQLPASISRRH